MSLLPSEFVWEDSGDVVENIEMGNFVCFGKFWHPGNPLLLWHVYSLIISRAEGSTISCLPEPGWQAVTTPMKMHIPPGCLGVTHRWRHCMQTHTRAGLRTFERVLSQRDSQFQQKKKPFRDRYVSVMQKYHRNPSLLCGCARVCP